MRGHHWYVWDANDIALCEGSRAKCLSAYGRNGAKNGLTLGYILSECNHVWMPEYATTAQTWRCGKCGETTSVQP